MRSKLRRPNSAAATADAAAGLSAGQPGSRPGGKRRSVGVATLLVAIVLIPLTAIAVLGISQLSARRTTVHHATHVRDALSRVDALIALREALHYEQTAADVRLRAVQFGLTAAQASALFGFSGVGHVDGTRTATDQALAHLARVKTTSINAVEAAPMPFDQAALQQLRTKGDEFLVVAEGIRDVSEAVALARRRCDPSGRARRLHFTVGACVGGAMALDGGDDAGHLLARADLALYRAKQRGRGNIEIYDERLQEELRRRSDIEQALDAALSGDREELVLHYQPVIDSAEGRVVMLEALIRWHRSDSEVLQPADFIPIAEASDLIIDVDVWVLRRVAAQITEWERRSQIADIDVAINVSGRHLLSQTLDDHLQTIFEETGVDPCRLIFEITETVLLSDLPTAAAELNKTRARGVRVAINDFGTGYTSIAHLQHLPVDTIKIDRSFVRGVPSVLTGAK